MANDTTNATSSELHPASTPPEVLISAVLHLMSHYSVHTQERPCTKLAAIIERHLKALAALPELAPVLRATCQQLCDQWTEVVDRALRPAPKTGFLGRLVTGARTN